MIAFEIFGRPIHRYGIFYLISFLCGYMFLYRLPRWRFLGSNSQNKQKYPRLHELLLTKLDDIFLIIMLWVIVWGRLGHVIFYERWYYSQHLLEIVQINQWGMSFVWGICGVVLGLLYLVRKHKLSRDELFLFGDMVLLIVPIWSLLWRYGNYLNQELVGKPLSQIWPELWARLQSLWLTHVFDQVDMLERINTNFLQSLGEWAVLLILWWTIFVTIYRDRTRPGMIAWVYMMWYGVLRFLVEFFKDLPEYEIVWVLSTSQWLSVVLFWVGLWLSCTARVVR